MVQRAPASSSRLSPLALAAHHTEQLAHQAGEDKALAWLMSIDMQGIAGLYRQQNA